MTPNPTGAGATDGDYELLAKSDELAFPEWVKFKGRLPDDVKETTHGSHYQAFRAGVYTGMKHLASRLAAVEAERDALFKINGDLARLLDVEKQAESERDALRATVAKMRSELSTAYKEACDMMGGIPLWNDSKRRDCGIIILHHAISRILNETALRSQGK